LRYPDSSTALPASTCASHFRAGAPECAIEIVDRLDDVGLVAILPADRGIVVLEAQIGRALGDGQLVVGGIDCPGRGPVALDVYVRLAIGDLQALPIIARRKGERDEHRRGDARQLLLGCGDAHDTGQRRPHGANHRVVFGCVHATPLPRRGMLRPPSASSMANSITRCAREAKVPEKPIAAP
jgi:hypothetical protein